MAHTVLVPWHLIFCRARFTPMNLASERNNHFALLIIGMNVLTQIAQANSLWISNFNTERCIKDSEHHVIGYSDFVVSMILCARGTPRSRNADHTARTCERFCLLYSQNNKSYDYQTCIAEIFLRFFLKCAKVSGLFFTWLCSLDADWLCRLTPIIWLAIYFDSKTRQAKLTPGSTKTLFSWEHLKFEIRSELVWAACGSKGNLMISQLILGDL